MTRLIGLVAGLVLIGGGVATVAGQSGGGGGGGGVGGFGDCFACDNIWGGFLHCDGEGGEMVAGGEGLHECPLWWPGSCHSEHPDACGLMVAATEFRVTEWSAGILSGATFGVCFNHYRPAVL